MSQTRVIDQVGGREDLSDLIAVADAKTTPVSSMARKGKKIASMLYEWQVDAYDKPRTKGVPEGKDVDVTENKAKNRVRLQGRAQRLWRTPKVTTEAETVSDVAGVASEYDYAKAKSTEEIKRDVEATIVSDNDSSPDAGDGENGSQLRGFGKWVSNTEQGELIVPPQFRTPAASIYSGTIANFNEDALISILQSRYTKVGAADELLGIVEASLKRAISDMSRYDVSKAGYGNVRRFNNEATGGTLYNVVDIYAGDFGKVTILPPHSFLPKTWRGYFLDSRFYEIRPHTNPGVRDLENRGGGPTAIVDTILGLAVTNPLAMAKVDPSDAVALDF